MTGPFFELITAYAEAAHCSCMLDPEDTLAILDIAGVTMRITEQPEGGFFLVQTGVAALPEKGAAREAFCMELLKANNLFSGTAGFTLGVDESQGLATLQLYHATAGLTTESFTNILNNAFSTAADCLIFFNNWSYTPEASDGPGEIAGGPGTEMIFC